MKPKIVVGLAIAVFVVAILQKSPAAFLSHSQTDFAWGLSAGLAIGAAVAWWAGR